VEPQWQDVGSAEELGRTHVQEIRVGGATVALTCRDGVFGAISGTCLHVGGPLGQGTLDGDHVVCPWHYWKFHRVTGEAAYAGNRVARHEVKVENGRVLVAVEPATRPGRTKHDPHPLARDPDRPPGPPRVLGISTTMVDPRHPRYSTSESLLESGLLAAKARGAETRLLRLAALSIRNCEGFYSKSAQACTWPCSITMMDPKDQMDQVYEGMIHWADVIVVATPIRWGAPSSLYFKMAERMNCIQNQITIRDRVLMRNKVACFVITGGQDNVQAVAGQMLMFFGELGCVFPPFPFVAHTRGWPAEDMENNVRHVQESADLREGAAELVCRAVEMAQVLLGTDLSRSTVPRGGRKAN
jgi:multimeric flavodoxin WrbA/nitrite reductase/ring-hydroxylating ferredoxin subunit